MPWFHPSNKINIIFLSIDRIRKLNPMVFGNTFCHRRFHQKNHCHNPLAATYRYWHPPHRKHWPQNWIGQCQNGVPSPQTTFQDTAVLGFLKTPNLTVPTNILYNAAEKNMRLVFFKRFGRCSSRCSSKVTEATSKSRNSTRPIDGGVILNEQHLASFGQSSKSMFIPNEKLGTKATRSLDVWKNAQRLP